VEADARIVTAPTLYANSDIILRIHRPTPAELKATHPGQVIIGMLAPLLDPLAMAEMASLQLTTISLDAIPRTISRAQGMDALSSQANVAGYKAVLIAAESFGRFFPLLTTPAGTAKPAQVLVLGVGVAGLQAIATARRLGAQVKAYDVRRETKEQVESLGAQFVTLTSVTDASGEGGYARALTAGEQAAQQAELNDIIATQDVVITTAQVPGRRPPILVTSAAVEAMGAGSIIIDMAASELGGNCELSNPDKVTITANGVEIHAPTNLPSSMPTGASTFYSRNISNLLLSFVKSGELRLDFDDPVTAATVITHGGKVVQEATRKLLQPAPRGGVKA
jgi:NAD(P) transhydrogenase subunit alpha